MQTVLLKIMGNFMPFGKVDRFSVLIYFLMYALSMLNLFNFVCNFLNKYLHVKRERYKYLFSRYNLMLQLPSAALFPLRSLVFWAWCENCSSVGADRGVRWAGSIHHLEDQAKIKRICAKQKMSFTKTIT